MAKYKDRSAAFLADVEQRVVRALDRTGRRGKAIAKPLTPVLTGYAQKSVHHVVLRSNGTYAVGDITDDNGNTVPSYPTTGRVQVYVGSNTAPRPDQYTGAGGYYVGLEQGIYSRKGSNMLGTALSVMIDDVQSDIIAAFR